MNDEVRNYIKKYTVLTVLIVLAAASQTLSMKANIGVCACWDALTLNIYQLCGMKVGTVSILINFVLVIIQILIMKKEFPPVKFLQIPLAIIYGTVTNFMYYNVLTFEVNSYAVKMTLLLMSYAGLAIFIGGMTIMDIITTPLEGTCYIINQRYHISFSKLRMAADIGCIALSIAMSLTFDLTLKVREGTLIGMIILGPLMGYCMKKERKLMEKHRLVKLVTN